MLKNIFNPLIFFANKAITSPFLHLVVDKKLGLGD
jgi:hypothetical protein